MDKYIIPVAEHFRENANAEKAAGSKKYMLNQYEYFGVQAPLRKEIYKQIFSEQGFPDDQDLRGIIEELWALPEREFQYFAMSLLEKRAKNANEASIRLYEFMITHKSWWDTVDFIAINLVGIYFEQYDGLIIPVTEKWMRSGNIWLQRSSLLFQLKYKKQTDTSLLFSYILRLAGSKEFFIRKAIGWVLRELSKTDPENVIEFVNNHQLAPLSKREALKRINRKQ